MMRRLLRIARHRWRDEGEAARTLGAGGLQRLQQRVAASEARHSGEIRLSIEAGLPLAALWRGASARARALQLFGTLGVWDTELNNGVLIYLLLAERAIEIVCDRGLARHVPAAHWQAVVARLGSALASHRFEDGLMEAIAAVEAPLLQHFALAAGAFNPNELPDAPDLR